MSTETNIKKIYQQLHSQFGPQHWWPARTRFEVIVGAILTQNTNWGNVERALTNLRRKRLLTIPAVHHLSHARLSSLIKPSGYFNIKAKRLKNFIHYLVNEYGGNLHRMARQPLTKLRREFLNVNGVGPETADSILLYAFNKPIFVIDAYTKRIFYRHNIVDHDADYHSMQRTFEKSLGRKTRLFNEYHALIVKTGKDYCKPLPRCEQCPLNKIRYSLDNRCHFCYRAFPTTEKRFLAKHYSLPNIKGQQPKQAKRFVCLSCLIQFKVMRRGLSVKNGTTI